MQRSIVDFKFWANFVLQNGVKEVEIKFGKKYQKDELFDHHKQPCILFK